jgi:hypothetical protein
MSSTQGAGHRSTADAAGAAPSPAPPAPPWRVQRDLDAWKQELRAEDARLDEVRVAAALVTVGLVRPTDLARALPVLEDTLRPTDRLGMLCEDEISVLLAPLAGIHEAQHLVQTIDAALGAAGVDVHVGWAMRQPGHGLFHALARADAAMLTAKGHGHLSLDLDARDRRATGR